MAVPAVASTYPTDIWVNEQQGWVVETGPCDSGLCGRLIGFLEVRSHPPGYVPRDVHNPDPARRGEPLCGMLLMGGFNPSTRVNGRWEGGWIYDPDSGETYSGIISLSGDTVKLRGYVGIPLFGRTLTLHRETGAGLRCSGAKIP